MKQKLGHLSFEIICIMAPNLAFLWNKSSLLFAHFFMERAPYLSEAMYMSWQASVTLLAIQNLRFTPCAHCCVHECMLAIPFMRLSILRIIKGTL